MPRPGARNHPKFRRLVKLLGEPESHVFGYLNMMWDGAYENGEPLIGDALDVLLVCGYPGDQEKIARALVSCGGSGDDDHGYIDEVAGQPGRYEVHDLFAHCPEYVLKRRLRELARATGVEYSVLRVATTNGQLDLQHPDLTEIRARLGTNSRPPERPPGEERHRRPAVPSDGSVVPSNSGGQRPPTEDNGGQRQSVSAIVAPPAPAPAPAPQVQEQTQQTSAAAGAGGGGGVPSEAHVLELHSPDGRGGGGNGQDKPRKAPSNPDVKRLVDHYHDEFVRIKGEKPVIRGGAAGEAAKALLSGRTFEDAAKLVTRILENPPPFNAKEGLLRFEDMPAAATKVLARASPGVSRASDGMPTSRLKERIVDTIETDETGQRRRVRIFEDPATGKEIRRTWGRPTEVQHGQ